CRPPGRWAARRGWARAARSRSERHAQPERVVDGGVDVARGDGVADAEELVDAVGIACDRLRPSRDERAVVDLALVAGAVLAGEVEVVERQGAVLDPHLVDEARLRAVAIVAAEYGCQPVALAPHGKQARVDGDAHAMRLEALGIGNVVEAADLRREEA